MKYAVLVARREYVENAKTKGFWIGMFLFPTILFLMIQVPIWLQEKATPVRYFALVINRESWRRSWNPTWRNPTSEGFSRRSRNMPERMWCREKSRKRCGSLGAFSAWRVRMMINHPSL